MGTVVGLVEGGAFEGETVGASENAAHSELIVVAKLSIFTGACERQLALIAVLAKIASPVVWAGRVILAFNHGVAPLLDPPLTLHTTVHVFDIAV